MAQKRYYRQEKVNTCAVASLRTVLALQFGVRIPEAALEALGTTAAFPIAKHGTTGSALRQMLKGASRAYNTGKRWSMTIRTQGTLSDLAKLTKKKRAVICRVKLTPGSELDDYHAIVVLGVNSRTVKLFDPGSKEKGPTTMTHAAFISEWLDPVTGETWYAKIGGTLL